MLALKQRMGDVFRALLIAMILFNALVPTAALASSSVDLDMGKQDGNKTSYSPENNFQHQSFPRPTYRAGEKLDQTRNTTLQTPSAESGNILGFL